MGATAVIVPIVAVILMALLFCLRHDRIASGSIGNVKECWKWMFVDGYAVVDPEPDEPPRRGQCTNPKIVCILLFIAVLVTATAGVLFSELDVSGMKAIGGALLVLLALVLWVFQASLHRLLPKDLKLLFPLLLIAIIVGGFLLITGFAICAVGRGKHCADAHEYYVRQMANDTALLPNASAFPVAVPTAHRDVAHLKKAIKAELPKTVAAELMSANIRIFKQASPGGEWVALTDPETALGASSGRMPYGFLLP